jgi:hypothetical protein
MDRLNHSPQNAGATNNAGARILSRTHRCGNPFPRVFTAIATLLLCAAPAIAAPVEEVNVITERDAECDIAVRNALIYIASRQADDGHWSSPYGRNTGVCSLAVMAFLAAGHLPGEGPFGDVLNRGIDFVVASQQSNGLLVKNASHGPMYSHAVATLMLAEVVGMTTGQRNRSVRDALAKAVKLLLNAQRLRRGLHRGGWRYQHTGHDADISVSGWCVMALKAAKNAGANVPVTAIDDAIDFIKRTKVAGGGFSYQARRGGPNQARTGTGILCLEIAGYHQLEAGGQRHHPEAIAGGEWLLRHPFTRFNGSHFYYGIYYTCQAMFQLGGKYWQQWFGPLEKLILANQNGDGSWPAEAGSAQGAGEIYATAMTVLALSVKYRYLPIYQR